MEGEERGYWRWSKRDFFPEESFQSFGSYRAALSQTCSRFNNRLASRSDYENERFELRKQSEHEMKRCLAWWDLLWFGFGSVIGAGIFVLTDQEAHEQAGPAIVLSYVVSGFSALLSVFCYTVFSFATSAPTISRLSRSEPPSLKNCSAGPAVIFDLLILFEIPASHQCRPYLLLLHRNIVHSAPRLQEISFFYLTVAYKGTECVRKPPAAMTQRVCVQPWNQKSCAFWCVEIRPFCIPHRRKLFLPQHLQRQENQTEKTIGIS